MLLSTELITDDNVLKAIGGLITLLLAGLWFLLKSIYKFLFKSWEEYKSKQDETNKSFKEKIDEVTTSLGSFIEETAEMKKNVTEIKEGVGLIRRDVEHLQSTVDKHDERIEHHAEKIAAFDGYRSNGSNGQVAVASPVRRVAVTKKSSPKKKKK